MKKKISKVEKFHFFCDISLTFLSKSMNIYKKILHKLMHICVQIVNSINVSDYIRLIVSVTYRIK